MAPNSQNSNTEAQDREEADATRSEHHVTHKLPVQSKARHDSPSLFCRIVHRLLKRKTSVTVTESISTDIAKAQPTTGTSISTIVLSLHQKTCRSCRGQPTSTVPEDALSCIKMATPETRKSKLPRMVATTTSTQVSTPQSNPRYRAKGSAGRIPRPSDGTNPSRAGTKASLATDKPLPSAPRDLTPTPMHRTQIETKEVKVSDPEVPTDAFAIGPARTDAAHTDAIPTDEPCKSIKTFSKTELDIMGMPKRKPSPSDTLLLRSRPSATPLIQDSFTVRKLRTTSPAGDGPVLRISDHANSVIFGSIPLTRTGSPSTILGTSDDDAVTLSRQRTLDALEGRCDLAIEPAQGQELDHLQPFVEIASQFPDSIETALPPAIPERLRPVVLPEQKLLRIANDEPRDSSETVQEGSLNETPGLAITTSSCHRIDEHEWVASGRRSAKSSPIEPFPMLKYLDGSMHTSDVDDNSRLSQLDCIEQSSPPETPLLGPPSSASTVNLSNPGAPRLVSRMPVSRLSCTPSRAIAIEPHRQAINMSTVGSKYATVKDRRFGFRSTTKSSSTLPRSTSQTPKQPVSRFSMLEASSKADIRSHRTPVRTIFSDFVHRRKSRKEARPESPLHPPPKPTTVRRFASPTTAVPKGLSVRKTRAPPAVSKPPTNATATNTDPVERHNAAMKQAQNLRARIREATSRMTAGKGKLDLLQATELFNSTTKHSVAALSACERARVSALEAHRFWELTLAAMYSNMSMLEAKIGRVGSVGGRRRRGSF